MTRLGGLLVLVAVMLATGDVQAKKKRRPPPPKLLIDRPVGPASLHVEGLDLDDGKVVVLIGGAARAIDARQFTFHDDRNRHFIALAAKCEPAKDESSVEPAQSPDKPAPKGAAKSAPPSKIRCTIDYPRAYAGAVVTGLSVFLGGREVEAPPDEVARKFDSARATSVLPRAVPRPATTPTPARDPLAPKP